MKSDGTCGGDGAWDGDETGAERRSKVGDSGIRRYVGGILFLEGSSSESEDSSERADFLKGN